jgi:hypothetical protein
VFRAYFDIPNDEIVLTKILNSGAAFSEVTVSGSAWLASADHTAPAVWINPTDDTMHVVFTNHNDADFEMRKSTDGTFTAFGSAIDLPTEITGETIDEFTYNWVIRHTEEAANDVKIITRGRRIADNNRGIHMLESSDGGDTFGVDRRILVPTGTDQRPYMIGATRGAAAARDRTYLPFSDSNPGDSGSLYSMRVAMLDDGTMKDPDGTTIGDAAATTSYTVLHAPTAGSGTRPMDACMDANGLLCGTFSEVNSTNYGTNGDPDACELHWFRQDSVGGSTFTVEKIRDADASDLAPVLWGQSAVDHNDSRFVFCSVKAADDTWNVHRFYRSGADTWVDQGPIWAGYPGVAIPDLDIIESADDPRLLVTPELDEFSGTLGVAAPFRDIYCSYLHPAGAAAMSTSARQALAVPSGLPNTAALGPEILLDLTQSQTFWDAQLQLTPDATEDVRRASSIGGDVLGAFSKREDLTAPVRVSNGLDFSNAATDGIATVEQDIGPDWFICAYVTANSISGRILTADLGSVDRVFQLALTAGGVSIIAFESGGTVRRVDDAVEFSTGSPQLVTAYCLSGSLVLRVNGTQIGSPVTVSSPASVSGGDQMNITLGNRIHVPASDEAGDCTIHRLCMFTTGGSAANVATIEAEIGAAL